MKKCSRLLLLFLTVWMVVILPSCFQSPEQSSQNSRVTAEGTYSVDTVPSFSGEPYVEINGNVPYFSSSEYRTKAFEIYSDLDRLGRCGITYACVCRETMPTEKRGSIGQVKPSGWQTVKYDFVDGQYLYNRCHLIGYQLTAENANVKNLITGTRDLNVDGMLPFENMVADYVKETNHHVLYRVTPIFDGDNLVARGVEMEAYSVEDHGEGICFNIYAYNNQPGVEIDYATGYSWLANSEVSEEAADYILNTNNKKIHLPDCSSVAATKEKNKESYHGTIQELLRKGYTPCNKCLPQQK